MSSREDGSPPVHEIQPWPPDLVDETESIPVHEIQPRPSDWVADPASVTLPQLIKGIKLSHAAGVILAISALFGLGMKAEEILEARHSTTELHEAHRTATEAQHARGLCEQAIAQTNQLQELLVKQEQIRTAELQLEKKALELELATCRCQGPADVIGVQLGRSEGDPGHGR